MFSIIYESGIRGVNVVVMLSRNYGQTRYYKYIVYVQN